MPADHNLFLGNNTQIKRILKHCLVYNNNTTHGYFTRDFVDR